MKQYEVDQSNQKFQNRSELEVLRKTGAHVAAEHNQNPKVVCTMQIMTKTGVNPSGASGASGDYNYY